MEYRNKYEEHDLSNTSFYPYKMNFVTWYKVIALSKIDVANIDVFVQFELFIALFCDRTRIM